MPAAAVTPAPLAYAIVVAVKTLKVGLNRQKTHVVWRVVVQNTRTRTYTHTHTHGTVGKS